MITDYFWVIFLSVFVAGCSLGFSIAVYMYEKEKAALKSKQPA